METFFTSAVRRRIATGFVSRSRKFSTSACRRTSDSSQPPRPPPPIEDSTSALDYKRKTTLQHRPPPLPVMDVRSRSAEEAVTNILYNTPPPSLQPFKRHVLNCLVQNEPGVLSRVSGILAGRGFNIDSLVVCRTEVRDLSRMCVVLRGQDGVIEQARRQLEDLVPVWAVLDYTETHCIERELLLAKVSILGPEYVDQQLQGGPTHDPRRSNPAPGPGAHEGDSKLEREMALVQNLERGAHPDHEPHLPPPLTPTQALALRSSNLNAVSVLSKQFGGRIVDVSENTVIIEMSGKTKRVEAFLALLKPFGVLEVARTGLMVMPRTPIARALEDSDEDEDAAAIDASLLPPG